ncbi:MAG TPA: trypsin-like peptidase domain-containing protein [Tepidiformaceae bacterium]|nr:trypsin-like peptidase domain-containing protein [Thermoflexaceae bacterium]HMS57337.1 trypsin-like peptidase domain-containing protein [Tepidiformaceae bacterium]
MLARFILTATAIASLSLFAACGGGGDDDDNTGDTGGDATAAPTSAPTQPKELTPQEIVAAMTQSVVHIKATYPEGVGGGSGIVWEDGTHILTNAHVVTGAGSIKVIDPKDGRQISAKVVAQSPCDDVALLEVERGNFTAAKIGDSTKLAAGEAVVALGFPGTVTDQGSDKLTITRGIVSKTAETIDGYNDLIQTDAAINPGNSGGPLMNMKGEVIGINTLSVRSKQGQNYAISIGEAKFVAEKLKKGKNINWIGARLEQNYQGLAQQLNIKLAYTDGIVITGIDTGSPAAKANLGYSDLIYYVDNVNVPTVGAFCDVLRSRKAGDKIRIDITRTYTNGNHEDLYAEVVLE